MRALFILWKEEFSFRVLSILGAATLLLSYFLEVSRTEFIFIVLTIGAVLAVEALNTGIEEICDHVTPEEHPHIGKIKDIASGASLIVICAALVIGLTIFIPRIFSLL